MILPLKNTSLHIHPVFPGILLLSFLTGNVSIVYKVLALFLHECGHLAALRLFHTQPRQISLTPFGGLIELPEHARLSPAAAFISSAAGPFCSLLGCGAGVLLFRQGWFVPAAAFSFFQANALLLLFNLLPALPLDGGRMLESVLGAFFCRQTVSRFLLAVGNITALSLIGLSVYSAFRGNYLFAPGFAGLYILYGCGLEYKRSPYHYYSNLISRRMLPFSRPLPVQHLAVSGVMMLQDILPALKSNCYHLFQVLDKDGVDTAGQLNESQFSRLLMENDHITFSQALLVIKKQRF